MPPSSATPSNGPPITGKSIKRLPISAGQYHGSGIMVPSSERSYLEKGILAMPSMLGPRYEEVGIPETRKRLDWAVIEASEVSRDLILVLSVSLSVLGSQFRSSPRFWLVRPVVQSKTDETGF